MLMIRLQRTGRKHEPTFRVVLTDSKNGPKSGKYLKNFGWYDTRLKNDAAKQLDVDQIKGYMKNGAKLSVTLHNFLVSQKIIEGKKINALPLKKPIKKAEAAAEAPKTESAPAQAVASETKSESPAASETKTEAPAEPKTETPAA